MKAVEAVANDRGTIEFETTLREEDVDDFTALRVAAIDAISGLAGDKSPGYPLTIQYHNNAKALEGDPQLILGAVIARAHLLFSDNPDIDVIVRAGSRAILQCGLRDPTSVFIKNEPHPLRKTIDGRYRCISAVSAIDQAVETIQYSEYNSKLRERLYTSGSAVGIGFTDKQNEQFVEKVQEINQRLDCKPHSGDKSGFDALHTQQTLLATVEIDKIVVPNRPRWHRANERWVHMTVHSVAMIGGKLYSKLILGMIDSGSKDTSRRNSLLCATYSYYLCFMCNWFLVFVMCNGDDDLVWGIKNLRKYLEAAHEAGIKLRDVQFSEETLDFCSHRYKYAYPKQAELTSWRKGVYGLTADPSKTIEDIMQFVEETRWNENHQDIKAYSVAVNIADRVA